MKTQRQYPVPAGARTGTLTASATLDQLDLAATLGNQWASKILAKENAKLLASILGADQRLPYGVATDIDDDLIVTALVRGDQCLTATGWEPFTDAVDEPVILDADEVAFVARAFQEGWDAVVLKGYAPLAMIAAFDPGLHPRGKDGKFIEIGGLVKLLDVGDNDNRRGRVRDIRSDPDGGAPDITVDLDDGSSVRVKPRNILQAPDKARLSHPPVDTTGPPRPTPDDPRPRWGESDLVDPEQLDDAELREREIDFNDGELAAAPDPETRAQMEAYNQALDEERSRRAWRRSGTQASGAVTQLPAGARVLAIVDEGDRNAVLDVVAVLPGPKVMRRHDGMWQEDPDFVRVLRSVKPPPVVELDEAQVGSVLPQVDEQTAGTPFSKDDTPKPVAAAAWSARADEMAIEFALLAAPVGKALSQATPGGRMPHELMTYWSVGPGAAKIRWGTPGAWRRCHRQLTKYVGPLIAKGLCTNIGKRRGGKGVAWDVG